ncbi:hypothetical protein [Phycicoccus flavus]|uniref:hypothetical protein n=1 Tax=Phycicoccus flavus TaxID=2502783 RepID=UPI000FEBADD5|nr:hypothetical protein [Phycicoccus flavus]NHA69067.1 hypothetical protein [Phycicoccus flavus]
MGPGDTRLRRVVAGFCLLVVLVSGLWHAVARDDPATGVTAVGFVVVVWLLGGPVLRWLRRGDGPYDTGSDADRSRADRVRMRYPGDNRGG